MAALIEKLTNGIEAVLMRKCFEAGIDPKSKQAPTSMHEAVGKWFARNLWDNRNALAEQALDIQLKPSGPRGRTSLVVYDNGEGQEPNDFPQTFLSLRNSNKKDIPFVQGMYNMGGTGAIVFCGHKKYQLIGSRRHDGTGYFGFTLIRRHPLSNKEESSKKDVWYEYFVHEGKIPRFPLTLPMDLHLQGREFEKGLPGAPGRLPNQIPTGIWFTDGAGVPRLLPADSSSGRDKWDGKLVDGEAS